MKKNNSYLACALALMVMFLSSQIQTQVNLNPSANVGISIKNIDTEGAQSAQFYSKISTSNRNWIQTTKKPCKLIAPPNQTLFTKAGSADILAPMSTQLPKISESCDPSYKLMYRINGGDQNPENTLIKVPIGINTITWELLDPSGGGLIKYVNQKVNVAPTRKHPTEDAYHSNIKLNAIQNKRRALLTKK